MRFTKENLKEIGKSEFETEGAFAERLRNFYKRHNEFSLKIAPDYFRYDAETEKFRVSFAGSYDKDHVLFVKRSSSDYTRGIVAFEFLVGRPAAEYIKENAEFFVYGYPVGFVVLETPQFVPTKIEVKSKDTGAIYYTKTLPNFLSPLPENLIYKRPKN